MKATLLDIDATNGVAKSPDPAIVASGNPTSVLWNGVDLGGGVLLCGQWIGQPGEMIVRPRAHHEMFTVIEGLVEIEDDTGHTTRVAPGQAGFIPKGWSGIWRTLEETRKTYMLLKAHGGEEP